MTDTKPSIPEGSDYVVFFEGGPSDGRTDTRVSTNGSYDDEIVDYVLVEGIETGFVYKAREATMNQDQLQVHYALDEGHSDPVDALENRGDRSGEFDQI